MRKLLWTGALAALLAACDTTVTKEEMATAEYGPRPEHWQEEIRNYLSLRLSDPKEAKVEFRAGPKLLYQRGTLLRGEQYGWGVCVWVNDRKDGEYQGYYPMTFLLRDEKIVHVNGGPDDGAIIGPNYARKQCEQLGAPPVPR
ncbi:MAG TPA: hypothetical protein VF211_05735 [Burkholderiales bacterium]